MQIQVHTDRNIDGHERLIAHVENVMSTALRRFHDRVTRLEVHLSDQNGAKSGPGDKQCVLEARLSGHQPIAVTHHAGNIDQAIEGAIDRLEKAMEKVLGRGQRRVPLDDFPADTEE